MLGQIIGWTTIFIVGALFLYVGLFGEKLVEEYKKDLQKEKESNS
ncbi:MAG: hypothetical protein SPK70_00655 [Succinivibrio dextrinosolvens]|nr:hypothetical protein [Succinivibrio dextrinosolvens]MDY6466745.1 hypothetical protein [Succinivibrio dextrinosolvens]MDY6469560.1 hypothetical protein [Succinivibrio dextrinosolvens]